MRIIHSIFLENVAGADMSKWNIALLSKDEQDKVSVDKAAAAVAWQERMNKPCSGTLPLPLPLALNLNLNLNLLQLLALPLAAVVDVDALPLPLPLPHLLFTQSAPGHGTPSAPDRCASGRRATLR
ncbi:TPA: DNA polymerase III subunit theta [Klebsiella pneumoniae]|nr:DNA polymerase III subunit theta [Klebsiella pneumoniae]HBX3244080.1 DNA polymerase III subunit theta [Klebsiella pneumoniae]